MSKGPVLQGDMAVPLRCVHKTEEQKKIVETPQIQKKVKVKKKKSSGLKHFRLIFVNLKPFNIFI